MLMQKPLPRRHRPIFKKFETDIANFSKPIFFLKNQAKYKTCGLGFYCCAHLKRDTQLCLQESFLSHNFINNVYKFNVISSHQYLLASLMCRSEIRPMSCVGVLVTNFIWSDELCFVCVLCILHVLFFHSFFTLICSFFLFLYYCVYV